MRFWTVRGLVTSAAGDPHAARGLVAVHHGLVLLRTLAHLLVREVVVPPLLVRAVGRAP